MMEWRKSVTGHDILFVGGDNYLSFGKDGDIRWVHASYLDHKGIRRGAQVSVTFTKVPKEVKSNIGPENIAVLKEAFKTRVDNGVLKRDKFIEFASALSAE